MSDVGLPIAKRTLCTVDNHVWVSTSSNYRGEVTIRPGQPCDCGRQTWPPTPNERDSA